MILEMQQQQMDSDDVVVPAGFAERWSVPCSFAQQRLWFLDRLEPGSAVYNLASALRLTGRLDVPALERSFQEVVRRHEALRTTFEMEDGSPVQVVHGEPDVRLELEDLGPAPEAEVRRRVEAEAGEPFDLQRGPLVRGRILRLGAEDHVVLLTMHHIVSDGWSMGVLIREVSALYAAFSQGLPSPLEELPVQYADYAVWQREQLDGEALAGQVAYWKGRLEGLAPLLRLPTDRARPAVPAHRGATEALTLSEEVSEGLRRLGRREGATLYMALLAGFQALLGRYAGEEDVAVGSPLAGRTRSELEGLIGCFVNTLVMRTDLSGNPTAVELLRRVWDVAMGAYAHQDVPFEKLVEELQPERSLSHHPLFQVMFVLQNAPEEDLKLPGLSIRPLADETSVAKLDLLLSLHEAGGRVCGTLEYDTDLFEGETIRRMVGHLETLLEGMAADPEARPMAMPLLRGDERHQVLVQWNATAAEFPRLACIHELFERQAERSPDATAVAFEKESLSYRELDRRGDRLARHLRGLGVGPEVRVGVCVERSLEMAVGLLGILKAGGAYVPVDPEYPRERVTYLLEDSGVRVVLTQRRLAGRLPEVRVRMVCLDGEWGEDEDGEEAAGGSLVAPENLAYVIYTSGSTGKPKGVQIPHRSLVNFVADMGRRLEIGGADRLLSVTSLSFDIFGLELFVPLACGAEVRLASRETTLDGALLARMLEEAEATVMQSTPATWRMLLAAGWSGRRGLKLLCGGEALAGELAGRLLMLPEVGQGLWNLFGPTETAIWSTVHPVVAAREPMPIGRPIANTELYVLDRHLEPAPVRVPGELYIGGGGLARGYLQRGDLTAERFVPHPFAGRGERLYRTGDLARYLPDGTVEFLGRIDHQVKVRGFRIEPGEIEAVLDRHPGVEQAVVVAREDRPGDQRLVAYVTGRSGGVPGAGELRDYLAAQLPEHMLPSAFVALERLPLTPNGKVDRRALPAPGTGRSDLAREYVVPRTAVEEVLAGIWAETLGVERVGAFDSFFEIGGHSLLATRVVGRVRETLKAELPLRAVFERPTLAAFAELVESVLRSGGGVSGPPLERRADRGPDRLPLSYAQQRLWFLQELEPGGAAYNLPAGIRLEGPLDVRTLERSLNEVLRRHEALRTSFEIVDGAPVQVIAERAVLPLPVVDLSGLRGPERDEEAARQTAGEAARGFDLTRAPLLRARVLRLGGGDHAVLLTMHHAVSDDWSMGLLIREVSTLYTAFVSGRRSPLPELPLQYADYSLWQREWLRGEVLEAQMSYWRERLRGLPPLLALPADRERPAERTQQGAEEPFLVPEEVAGPLAALCRREGVTLYMALLAALQALLGRYSGEDDVAVGSPIAGRTRRELEGLIGVFVNTLVMRTGLAGHPTVRELLQRVRDVALGAYGQQDVPFEKLVEELRPERSLGHHPLFQVMLVLQNAPGEELRLPHLTVRPLAGEISTAKFDLLVSLHEASRRLHGTFQYSTDLFERETIRRMAGHFQRLLAAMAADPGARLMELPLLTGGERHRVLAEWNDTAVEHPSGDCLHELIAAQARRTPDAVAVVCEDARLSYAELGRRGDRLARHLRGLGVGPEVRVGVCVERSLEMAVGLLGVLTAGGAYVPVDPEYPRERVAYLLEDSGVRVVLTQRRLAARLPGVGGRVVCLDGEWGTEEGEAGGSRAGAENLAYVIYTSGSTGKPKGVQIPHRSLVNFVADMGRRLEIGGADRLLSVTSLSFDIFGLELFVPLACGAEVRLATREATLDGELLARTLEEAEATVMQSTPATWRMLLAAGWSGRRGLKLLCGGEALAGELAGRLLLLLPERGQGLWNLFGPTETTIWSTVHSVEGAREPMPIGRPIANTQLYVLDRHLEPVPVRVPGELYIGGDGLARGYLHRGDLTAERFVPHPFLARGERLYQTGDLARHLPDGNVEYLGRIDHQVKVRGFRIELGEIESVLALHPEVAQSVVVAREDRPGDKRLVAYVVGRDGRAPEARELRGHLAEKLPEHMLPSTFVALESLPLTPNGKLDRRALPAPGRSAAGAGSVAPRTGAERVLARIWAEVLGLGSVGIEESFFELGGDSILCIQVVAQAREAGYRLTLKQIFQHKTVAELARVAVPVRGCAPNAADREMVAGEVALTPIQRWFFEQDLPNPHHFNQAVLLEPRERMDVAALEGAMRELVRHHDALRLRFEHGGAGWRQWNEGESEAGVFSHVDLSGAAQWRHELEVNAARTQESLHLAAGPLLRVVHFALGPAGERLLLVVHHLAVDGVSWQILLEDLQRSYGRLREGRPADLPAKTTSFQEWARRLAEHATSVALREEAGHWTAEARRPVAPLPVDHPAGENAVGSERVVSVDLDREATHRLLHEVPGVYRTQIDDVLLAALARAVAEWTGESRVAVELEGHGREELFEGVDLSRTVGWFTSLAPVLLDVGGCAGPGDVVKAVKEQLRQIPDRGIGYGVLRYLSGDGPGVQVRGLPPPEIRFNYLGQVDQVLPEAGLFGAAAEASGASRGRDGRRSCLLGVNGLVAGGCLRLDWTYSEAVHRRATVEALARSFVRALRGLIEHCLAPEAGGFTPSDFPLAGLDQAELQRIAALLAGDTMKEAHR